ncbi:required for drug-induced death protein 1 [Sminthopsis crassicaudata]|uniref:required for drug-induced death protein 1 n=1 Tax=Sminthopsis crassicaudata TaxID=9301 RepID=UPI003D69C97D
MTVGARLRGKGDGGYRRRFPRWEQEEEEEAWILQHPHLEEEGEEGEETEGQEEQPQRTGIQGEEKGGKAPHSKKVHFAFLPERYETLEEQTTGEKPKKKYRKKLKKYGKNVGKVITKGCRYFVIGLQGLATAYSSPFAASATFLSLVR